jgi:hypothetical protein
MIVVSLSIDVNIQEDIHGTTVGTSWVVPRFGPFPHPSLSIALSIRVDDITFDLKGDVS